MNFEAKFKFSNYFGCFVMVTNFLLFFKLIKQHDSEIFFPFERHRCWTKLVSMLRKILFLPFLPIAHVLESLNFTCVKIVMNNRKNHLDKQIVPKHIEKLNFPNCFKI
jgi:hypothetical protein